MGVLRAARQEAYRFHDYFNKRGVDNFSRTLKASEAACDLVSLFTGCEVGAAWSDISKAGRGMLYPARAYGKGADAIKGKNIPSVKYLGTDSNNVLQFVFAGLATIYTLRFVAFLDKSGVFDLGEKARGLVNSASTYIGIATGTLGAPLALWQTYKFSQMIKGKDKGDMIQCAAKEFSYKSVRASMWVNLFTFGQVGSEWLMGVNKVAGNFLQPKALFAVSQIARWSSLAKGLNSTPYRDLPKDDDKAAKAA